MPGRGLRPRTIVPAIRSESGSGVMATRASLRNSGRVGIGVCAEARSTLYPVPEMIGVRGISARVPAPVATTTAPARTVPLSVTSAPPRTALTRRPVRSRAPAASAARPTACTKRAGSQ